jgi:AraC-like DNA-binding protein
MTAFGDFIDLLRLQVNIYHNAKVCGDWVIEEHTLGSTCFHAVTTGRCLLTVPDVLETKLNTGDLIIFPKELEHQMRQIDNFDGEQQHLSYSTTLQGTGMLCGEVQMMHLYQSQLLDALPPIIIIRNTEHVPWLAHLIALIVNESIEQGAASNIALNRLSELLFVYALRHHIKNNSSQVGILALYHHDKLAKAITAFHHQPDKKWDLSLLAKHAGMSRTVFSATFKRISGWTVNQYTTWWRMQIAWEKLQQGDKVVNVALQVGYQSEAAFSRVFHQQFGQKAGKIRRNQATSQ